MKEWPRSLLQDQILQLKWYSKKVGVGFFSNFFGASDAENSGFLMREDSRTLL